MCIIPRVDLILPDIVVVEAKIRCSVVEANVHCSVVEANVHCSVVDRHFIVDFEQSIGVTAQVNVRFDKKAVVDEADLEEQLVAFT